MSDFNANPNVCDTLDNFKHDVADLIENAMSQIAEAIRESSVRSSNCQVAPTPTPKPKVSQRNLNGFSEVLNGQLSPAAKLAQHRAELRVKREKAVGTQALLKPTSKQKNNLEALVLIVDFDPTIGGHVFLVEPIGGSGSAWVKASRVVIG